MLSCLNRTPEDQQNFRLGKGEVSGQAGKGWGSLLLGSWGEEESDGSRLNLLEVEKNFKTKKCKSLFNGQFVQGGKFNLFKDFQHRNKNQQLLKKIFCTEKKIVLGSGKIIGINQDPEPHPCPVGWSVEISVSDPDPDSGVFWIRIQIQFFKNDYYDYDHYDDYDYDDYNFDCDYD